jgi:hypothetical protein
VPEPHELARVRAHRAVRGPVPAPAGERGERGRAAPPHAAEREEHAPGERRERAGVLGQQRDGRERVELHAGAGEKRGAVEERAVVRVPGDAVRVECQDLGWV